MGFARRQRRADRPGRSRRVRHRPLLGHPPTRTPSRQRRPGRPRQPRGPGQRTARNRPRRPRIALRGRATGAPVDRHHFVAGATPQRTPAPR
jgi:hypothetical protein